MNESGTEGCVRVLLFSTARDAAGVDAITLECPAECTQEEFVRRLIVAVPPLAPVVAGCRLARNHAYCAPDELFTPGDEIALIPPVSGG